METGQDQTLRLALRVKPGSRRTRIVGAHGAALKLEVNAPPERGKANEAVRRVLAECLQLPLQSVAVVAGLASRDKTIELRGISHERALQLLERAIAGA
jgi:uncharacterized protein (TIGR00251 family)